MIGVIDYGMGNLGSVLKAFDYLGLKAKLINRAEDFKSCGKLVLPGVGAFEKAIDVIKEQGFDVEIKNSVKEGKHLLGICLGMQLLFDESAENGSFTGLSVLKGRIIRLTGVRKIPHIGWNSLIVKKESPLFSGIPKEPYLYFVHSYHLETNEDIVSATCIYGKEIQVAAESDNIFALQFHPEKSGSVGLRILKNFGGLK